MLKDTFKSFVLADEFEGCARTNAFDGVKVIATEEYTEINELVLFFSRVEI